MKKVVITGIGAITNVGAGWENIRKNIMTVEQRFEAIPESIAEELDKSFLIGKIVEYDNKKYFTNRQLRLVDKFLTMSVSVAGMAIEDAGLENLDNDEKDEVGTFIGTSRPEFAGFQRFSKNVFLKQPQKLNPSHFPLLARNAAGGQIAISFGFRGYSSTISVNHLAGMHSIARGVDLIQNGHSKIVVTGGIESLSRLSIAHSSLLYKKNLSQPKSAFFGETDALIIPSEGACVLILEESEHANKRNKTPYAEINNYKMGRYDVPENLMDAIGDTLREADLNWSDIDLVSCSASGGCLKHDKDELKTILKIIEQTNHSPVLTASKSLFGEAEAFSSAMQVAITANALRHKEVFPTIHHVKNDNFKTENIQTDFNNGLIHAVDSFGSYVTMSLSRNNLN